MLFGDTGATGPEGVACYDITDTSHMVCIAYSVPGNDLFYDEAFNVKVDIFDIYGQIIVTMFYNNHILLLITDRMRLNIVVNYLNGVSFSYRHSCSWFLWRPIFTKARPPQHIEVY